MKTFKRYALALVFFIAVSMLLGVLADFARPLLLPALVPAGAETVDAWQQRTLLSFNIFTGVQSLLSFAVAAYVLRSNPVIPGLLLFFTMLAISVKILHSIALPADPAVTYGDILRFNPVGYVIGFVACVVGMGIGHQLSQRRVASMDERSLKIPASN